MSNGSCPRCGWAGGVKPRPAADLLGVSHQTVRNMIRSGELAGVVTAGRSGGSGYNYWIPVEALRDRGVDAEPDPASLRNCPRCGLVSWLTPTEAAGELGIAERTVLNRIRVGAIDADRESTSGGYRFWIALKEVDRLKEAVGV